MTLCLPLHRSHVLEQLGRLLRIYNRPKQAPADDREFATDYAQICGELSPAQFTGAVDAYLAGAAKWFPKPGELLALGRQVARGPGAAGLAAEYAEWEHNGWQDRVTGQWTPCPVCGERMEDMVVRINADGSTVERPKIRHHASVHWKAGIPFTMAAREGTGGGRYEHHVIDLRPRTIAAAPDQTEAALERAAIQQEAAP